MNSNAELKYSELNIVVFLELKRWINRFPTLRSLRLCVNIKTKSRKDAKDRKEKNTTLYIGYYLPIVCNSLSRFFGEGFMVLSLKLFIHPIAVPIFVISLVPT